MEVSKLTSAAVEALQHRESTGKAVTSVTVEPTRDDSGWISYEDTALVTHHNGETQTLNIRDTALSAALEQHANDEAELGSVPTVVISVPLPEVTPNNRVRCEEHPGVHIETVPCRWPHNVTADGDWPQVGHPYRVTDSLPPTRSNSRPTPRRRDVTTEPALDELGTDELHALMTEAIMVADLEPGDEVVVFNRDVVGDDAAAAIEEKGATLHSVTEPHQPTRTFGYVRTANGSADLQRAAITEAVGAIRIFSDEGVSGTTAGTDRPGLRELLAELQAGDEVVVWQYDRLGRTFEAMRAVVELIIAKGATLRSLTESPADGLFSMKFMMAVAEYEHAWKLEK